MAVVATYFVKIYNGLVSLRENVKKAWSNIDVLLRPVSAPHGWTAVSARIAVFRVRVNTGGQGAGKGRLAPGRHK